MENNISLEQVLDFIENNKDDLVAMTKINNKSWFYKAKLFNELKKDKEEMRTHK
jgi:hypothetical protein